MRKLMITAASAAVLVAGMRQASANKYEVFIDISEEEELYDLFADGQIGEDSLATLQQLFQRGVNLNTASRETLYSLPNLTYPEVDGILAYRKEGGLISDPAQLVVAGILTDRKLLAISAFLRVVEQRRNLYATDGLIRTQTRWSQEDAETPPMSLLVRVGTAKNLELGFVGMVTRNRLGDVRYDPSRNALTGEAPSTQLHAPKFYAFWDTDKLSLIAGTYRVGFGQRLTFDNTDQITPNGIYEDDDVFRDTDLTRECKESRGDLAASPCDGEAGSTYVSPDFRWRDGLMGVAAGLKAIPVGPGKLQAYGFLSFQPRSIYQYKLYDKSVCDDPRTDSDECSSPDVFNPPGGDPLAPSSRFSFHTLPNMYRETIVGGNATFFADRRTHFGFTGYGSSITFLTDGIDLDFQEWSAMPFGGGFGAAGLDFAWGRHWFDVFGEVTQSFDNMAGGGGGTGAIVRGVATWDKNELETTFRYYDKHFANPHARPIAAADLYEGNRARDEVGTRVRYTTEIDKRLNVRTNADFWVQPTEDAPKLLVFVRGDLDISKQLRAGLWTAYQNNDLTRTGRDECYSGSETLTADQITSEGEIDIGCGGQKYQVTARARFAPTKKWSIAGQVQHEWLDDKNSAYDAKYRQDFSTWAILTTKPIPELTIRGRARYLFEGIDDASRLEESLWTYVDFTYRLPQKYLVRVRYDLYYRLDDRMSTQERVPSPENWLWLQLESKF